MHFAYLRKRLLKQRRFRQLLIASILLSVWLGIMIVPIEMNQPGGSIHSIEDGLWWSVQTLTTIGYGDVVPVSTLGRLLGVVLQILGTIMFGSLIALISTSMSRSQEEHYWSRLFDRLNLNDEQLKDIKRQVTFMVEKTERHTDSETPQE